MRPSLLPLKPSWTNRNWSCGKTQGRSIVDFLLVGMVVPVTAQAQVGMVGVGAEVDLIWRGTVRGGCGR